LFVQTLAQIREMLTARGLAPRHSLGQNFLVDHNLIRKLVDASGVGAGDLALEIGPGTGTMTEEILSRGVEVIACELDRGLAALLRERLVPVHPKLHLVEGDCLESKRTLNAKVASLLGERRFTLVANLPYGAATPLMTTLLTQFPNCSSMWVTVQREVAERMAARPGGKDYGLLSVMTQAICDVKPVAGLPPECFWPRPEVTSSMVGIIRKQNPLTDDPARLAALCSVVFGQRRKQLGSILGREIAWPWPIEARQRAEELTVEQLVALSRIVVLEDRVS